MRSWAWVVVAVHRHGRCCRPPAVLRAEPPRRRNRATPSCTSARFVVIGGIPGVLLGGRVADRFANRVQGAACRDPRVLHLSSGTRSSSSRTCRSPPGRVGVAANCVGIFAVTAAIPALRAGMADAVPAHLRGAGFGAFNLVSILFGAAAAPLHRRHRSRTSGTCASRSSIVSPPGVRRRVDPVPRAQPPRRRRDEDLRSRRARDAGRRSAPEPVPR